VRLATAAPSLQSSTAPTTSECSFDLMEATVRLEQAWLMSRRLLIGVNANSRVEVCPVDAIAPAYSVPPEWRRFVEINVVHDAKAPG
jgi:hypothetical protein